MIHIIRLQLVCLQSTAIVGLQYESQVFPGHTAVQLLSARHMEGSDRLMSLCGCLAPSGPRHTHTCYRQAQACPFSCARLGGLQCRWPQLVPGSVVLPKHGSMVMACVHLLTGGVLPLSLHTTFFGFDWTNGLIMVSSWDFGTSPALILCENRGFC